MEANTRCWLLVNPASGSNESSSAQRLCAALGERGWQVDRVIAFPDDPLPTRAALEAAGIELLVIYTGDGTMSGAINALAGWSGKVLALPGGTMNLLPLRLHRTLDVDLILDIAANGGARARRPDCVACDAGVALAGLLVGPGTAWSRVRESMRSLAIADMAKETVEAIRHTTEAAGIIVTDRRATREGGYPLVELTPGEHGIQIDGYYAEAPLDYAGQAWALLRRRFREGPHDRLGIAERVTLASADGSPLACLIDGEPAECASNSCFRVEPCGVDLLATSHEL